MAAEVQYVDRAAADELQCPLCMDVLKDPKVVCQNEHHLCKACADQMTQQPKRRQKCPDCRKPLKIKDGQRFVRNAVLKLQAYCPNRERGCQQTPQLDTLKAHTANCEHQLVTCEFPFCGKTDERHIMKIAHHHCDAARFGCQFTAQVEADVTVHMVDCAVSKCRAQFEVYERKLEEVRQPPGTLLAWCGKPSQLPSGWVLCDGQQGRPDWTADFVPPKRRRSGFYSFAYIIRQDDVALAQSGLEEDQETDDEEVEDEDEEEGEEDEDAEE